MGLPLLMLRCSCLFKAASKQDAEDGLEFMSGLEFMKEMIELSQNAQHERKYWFIVTQEKGLSAYRNTLQPCILCQSDQIP